MGTTSWMWFFWRELQHGRAFLIFSLEEAVGCLQLLFNERSVYTVLMPERLFERLAFPKKLAMRCLRTNASHFLDILSQSRLVSRLHMHIHSYYSYSCSCCSATWPAHTHRNVWYYHKQTVREIYYIRMICTIFYRIYIRHIGLCNYVCIYIYTLLKEAYCNRYIYIYIHVL